MPHIHEKIDFTVEVFVVHKNKVLLRIHDKYNIWLSVGGHIELDKDPVEAALREVKEEVGLDVKLYADNLLFKYEEKEERLLIPPIAMGRHNISETHEHVFLIYFATSETNAVVPEKDTDTWKWCTENDLNAMNLRPDILFHAKEALKRLSY